jgi:hypothetical protein
MIKKILSVLILFSIVVNAQQLNNSQQALNKTDKSFFIENKGQWAPEVKYLARIGGMNAWITNSGVVYDYYKINRSVDKAKMLKMHPAEKRDYENKNTTIQGHVVKLQLVNPGNNITGVGNNQREGYYNYFIGNDQSKWASNVPLYDNVEIQGVYKGIDVKYYYDNGMLRYDYKAKPGADISQLKFKFEGQDGIYINTNGELVLKTSIGEVTNGKIYAYQIDNGTQKEVECKFEQKEDGTIGLKTANYDANKELIIDPLVYSTFIGGYDGSWVPSQIATDDSGNTYITGWTTASVYPTTSGAYKTTGGGTFVTKLNSSGTDLVYSTFLGGNSSNPFGYSYLAVDIVGNVYVTGYTRASDFPTTNGAFQTILGSTNASNAFVTKLNSTGSDLIYSTFLGGSGGDAGTSIAIDASGNTFITGWASSSDFPTTNGAFQTILNGYYNAFVTKLNSNGSALVYSTLIGGNTIDGVQSIAIDSSGNAYIAGYTSSSDYPTTIGAYQTKLSNSNDNAFITKLNSSGSALVYSTFIGGNLSDIGFSLAIDAGENAYITGTTLSTNYPTTPGAYKTNFTGSGDNIFVTKLNSSGSALVYSTFIGGGSEENGWAIALDKSRNAYIAGFTQSPDFPTTSGAFQTALNGGNDAFVTKLNSTGSALSYSTFIGGSSDELGCTIALDKRRNAYIAGYTQSSDFPTTIGAYQTYFGTSGCNFVTKINIPPTYVPLKVEQISPVNDRSGITQPVKFTWNPSSDADSYRLQISSDSTFASATIDTTGITDTSISITGLSNLTTYYWRVNATNVEGTSPWSNIWSFRTLSNPTRPAIIYPAANSTNIPLNVNFKWGKAQDQLTSANLNGTNKQSAILMGVSGTNKIATVSNYWMQLATDTTKTTYIVNDSTLTDTTKLVSGLNYYTNYYWRVKALNESGWGASTAWSKFTTIIDTPAIVQQVSPAYGSIDSVMPVQLTWYSPARAASYRLQFSKDSTFSSAIIDTAGLTDTTFTFYELKNLITYYWRINATNAGGTSSWSNVWKFQIYVDPSLAVLAYPASNSINIPVDLNFRWSNAQDQLMLSKVGSGKVNRKSITKAGLPGNKKIAGLSRYWFQLMADTTSKSYIANDSTLTDTTKYVSGLSHLTNYFWRISVSYDTGWGAYTRWSKFRTVIDTPAVVQLIAPAFCNENAKVPLLFTWQSSSRAAVYRIQLSQDSTFTTCQIDTVGLADTNFIAKRLIGLTTYYWRVNASNAGGVSKWSPVWSFITLGNQNQSPLAYPENNDENLPVAINFKWNPFQDQSVMTRKQISKKNKQAVSSVIFTNIKKIKSLGNYWFQLGKDTTLYNLVVNDSTLTDTTIFVTGLSHFTNYWWRVRTTGEKNWGTYTDWSKFTTIVDTPGIVTLISPNGSSKILETAISVLFTWEKAPYASTYEYQIASDKNFGTVYWDTTNVSDTVSMYYGTVTSTFYWRVRGSNIAGTGPWSETMTVSTVTGTDRINKAIPVVYELYQNYPNPFNPSSKIRYALPFNSNVKIEIYNVLGQKVKELLNTQKNAGYYEVNFNTTGLASGVYLYMLYAKSTDGKSEYRDTKKMVLLK